MFAANGAACGTVVCADGRARAQNLSPDHVSSSGLGPRVHELDNAKGRQSRALFELRFGHWAPNPKSNIHTRRQRTNPSIA
jgi:hypothetical protein